MAGKPLKLTTGARGGLTQWLARRITDWIAE